MTEVREGCRIFFPADVATAGRRVPCSSSYEASMSKRSKRSKRTDQGPSAAGKLVESRVVLSRASRMTGAFGGVFASIPGPVDRGKYVAPPPCSTQLQPRAVSFPNSFQNTRATTRALWSGPSQHCVTIARRICVCSQTRRPRGEKKKSLPKNHEERRGRFVL